MYKYLVICQKNPWEVTRHTSFCYVGYATFDGFFIISVHFIETFQTLNAIAVEWDSVSLDIWLNNNFCPVEQCCT